MNYELHNYYHQISKEKNKEFLNILVLINMQKQNDERTYANQKKNLNI